MSGQAVDLPAHRYASWSDERCVRELAKFRWGGHKHVPCVHCGTTDEHHWRPKQLRWKCRACGSCFSVTSGTVFAHRKRSLQSLLMEVQLFMTGASGQPALEMRRLMGHRKYDTSYTLASKVREAFVRGSNVGLVSGIVEMDGTHASGHGSAKRRGKPQSRRRSEEERSADAQQAVENASQPKPPPKPAPQPGQVRDPDFGYLLPMDRRLVMAIRKRTGAGVKGSSQTRIGVGRAETPEVVEALIQRYVLVPESILSTDTAVAYNRVGKQFRLHLQVNHSETLVGPYGEHINHTEGLFARHERAERGIYLNVEPKYLMDYACEVAFRDDHRRLSPSILAARAFYWSLNVGESHYWRGFTHGKHRSWEPLVPLPQAAPASGPRKADPLKPRPRKRPA